MLGALRGELQKDRVRDCGGEDEACDHRGRDGSPWPGHGRRREHFGGARAPERKPSVARVHSEQALRHDRGRGHLHECRGHDGGVGVQRHESRSCPGPERPTLRPLVRRRRNLSGARSDLLPRIFRGVVASRGGGRLPLLSECCELGRHHDCGDLYSGALCHEVDRDGDAQHAVDQLASIAAFDEGRPDLAGHEAVPPIAGARDFHRRDHRVVRMVRRLPRSGPGHLRDHDDADPAYLHRRPWTGA
mmetsp:Transcript_64205/g.166792  ORF Transcript_64205/g.166792 Transcript_64205/m.166792 type:complete len:246 (-) Transcript_64205:726-1463(-)